MPSTVPEMNKRVFAEYVEDCIIITRNGKGKANLNRAFTTDKMADYASDACCLLQVKLITT
jgi:hypothetical protein